MGLLLETIGAVYHATILIDSIQAQVLNYFLNVTRSNKCLEKPLSAEKLKCTVISMGILGKRISSCMVALYQIQIKATISV